MEEGSHEVLWGDSESVYHSLVALQDAATDLRDEQITVNIMQEIWACATVLPYATPVNSASHML